MGALPPRRYKTCSSRYGHITETKTKNYRTSVICKRGWYPSPKWYAAFELLVSERRLIFIFSKSFLKGKALYDHLRGIHQQLKNKLDAELNVMEEIFNSSILSLSQLVRWQSLLTQLKVQAKQLELYQKELLQLTDSSLSQPYVCRYCLFFFFFIIIMYFIIVF